MYVEKINQVGIEEQNAPKDYYIIRKKIEVKDEKSASFFTDIIWEEPEDTVYGGDKNFKLVDIDTQHYDFHLSDKSKAIGAASTTYAPANDRDGKPRDDKPDMGCYEFREE